MDRHRERMTLVQTRIYRPLTTVELRRLGDEGVIGPAPFAAYTVTPGLRREHPGVDEEELEYLAFTDAVTTGLSGGDGGGGRDAVRVVAAADVDDELVVPAGDGPLAAVHVTAPVARRQVASFHVADAAGRRGPARAAADGIPELSWYDATELDVVVDLFG